MQGKHRVDKVFCYYRLRLWHEYFKLTTDTGLLVVVYHDLVDGTWYMQRLYD